MRSFTNLFLNLLLVTTSVCFAQRAEMGKVTKEELLEKSHPSDSGAVAAVLFESGSADLNMTSLEMTFVVKRRIKIYRKEGYDWANYQIPALINSPVNISEAVTYNLENGDIVESKLPKAGIYDQKISRFIKLKTLTMPNVREGSVIEYKYETSFPLTAFQGIWNFQSEIPVNYSEYTTIVPKVVISQPVYRGRNYAKSDIEFFQRGRDAFVKTISVATNVPALKEEEFVNNLDNYRSGIAHDWIGFEDSYGYIHYFKYNWPNIIGRIYMHPDFAPEIKKKGYFEKELDIALTGKTTADEKIEAVLDFAKSAVKWNGSYGYVCERGVKNAYKMKDGNIADINLMLTAMLRYAGFKAHPVVLSTRENGIPPLPRESSFDYVIAAVEQENKKTILLDASEKFSMPDVLPIRCLNWVGRIIRDQTFDIIKLMPVQVSRESVNMMANVLPDGKVTGKVKKQLSAYKAMIYRQSNSGLPEDQILQEMESRYNDIQISEFRREDVEAVNKPIAESWSFSDTGSAETIGDRIYISPLLFLAAENNPFKSESRDFPVDFGFMFETRYNITMEIPEGYEVESMPETQSSQSENQVGTYKYNIALNDNRIQLNVIFAVNKAIIPADQYIVIKSLYSEMIRKERERIVLVKKL